MVQSAITPTKKEMQLLEILRRLGWGEVKILVQHGEPVLLYESIKSVRLENDKPSPDEGASDDENRRSTIELLK